MQMSYKASAEQFSPRRLADLAVAAEGAGFDAVWVSDHLHPWRHIDGHAPFALSWLGHVAARTERVGLGTSVLTPTFRYHPALIAQAFATLEALHPGRFTLGVGSGEYLNEHAVGLTTWPRFAERRDRLVEAIELIRRLWTSERVDHAGRFFTTHDLTIYDRPQRHLPIVVAAGGPSMATTVGIVADGLMCTSGKGDALYRDELLPAVASGLTESDSPQRPFTRMVEIKLSLASSIEKAQEQTRFWAALSLSAEQKHSIADPAAMQRAADALPLETVSRRWMCVTSAQEAVEAVRPYAEWGFDHMVLHAPQDDQESFVRECERELLPALRESFGGFPPPLA